MDVKKIIDSERPQEHEISLWNLLKGLWRRVWVIILAALLGAGLFFGMNNKPVSPLYESSYTVFLRYEDAFLEYKGDKVINIPEEKNAKDLMSTYKLIVSNSHVLSRAAEEAGLRADADELKGMVKIELSSESPLVTVKAAHSEPEKLTAFVTALERISSEELLSKMEGSFISTMEEVSTSGDISVKPNPLAKAVIGAFLGIALSCAVIVIKDIAEDRVKSAKQLEMRSGILVLSSVPNGAKLKKDRM